MSITLNYLSRQINFCYTLWPTLRAMGVPEADKEVYETLHKEISTYTDDHFSEHHINISPEGVLTLDNGYGVSISTRNRTMDEWKWSQIGYETYLNIPIKTIIATCLITINKKPIKQLNAKRIALEYAKKAKDYIENYNKDCTKIVNVFCRKHNFYEVDCHDTYWIADKPGELLAAGDFTFDMRDIITDLTEAFEEDALLKWYDYSQDFAENGITPPYNYLNWYKLIYAKTRG